MICEPRCLVCTPTLPLSIFKYSYACRLKNTVQPFNGQPGDIGTRCQLHQLDTIKTQTTTHQFKLLVT